MVFPFKYVAAYTNTKPKEASRGFEEFWGKNLVPGKEDIELWQYYTEWIMFDFRLSNGGTFLIDYVLNNPDHLDSKTVNQFKQVAQTQNYSEYQTLEIEKGNWIKLEDIFTGKIYKVYDELASQSIPEEGSMFARIGKVNGKWYLVGANPAFYPITYTKRMKRNLQKNFDAKKDKLTPKDLYKTIVEQRKNLSNVPKKLTKQELLETRKNLENKFIMKSKKYKPKITFEELTTKIYEENRVNVLDFWIKLGKSKLTEDFVINEMQLFTSVWNHFPHKCLKGKAPVELYPH